MLDAKAFGAELAEMVKGALAPLSDRLDAIEKRLDELPTPRDGKDADPSEVAAAVAAEVKADIDAIRVEISAIPAPEAPMLPDVDALVMEAVKAAVSEAVAALPMPKDGSDGTSVTVDDVLPMLEKRMQDYLDALPQPASGKDGRDGVDGTSVTAEDVLPALGKQVAEFLAAIPAPRDGDPGKDGRNGSDGKDGVDGQEGKPGEKGADGIGLAGALIDRGGNLVVTLTNGEAKSLGPVVGKDGSDGQDGQPGIGFDDMTLDYDGERSFTFLFQKDERIEERSFTVPVVLDRGVYRADQKYAKGDAVTYGGSVWIAQSDTYDKPDGSAAWRLAVKRGRDGKDGVIKPPVERTPLRVGVGHAG